MNPYILVVITHLGGYASGPQISMQEFSSSESCNIARVKAIAMTDAILQANLQSYRGVEKSISAECVKK